MRGRYEEIREGGVEVVTIAPASSTLVRSFAAVYAVPFPLLADPELTAFRAYEVESHLFSLGQRPALYAIDRDGVVRYAYLGTQQWQLGSLGEALASLS